MSGLMARPGQLELLVRPGQSKPDCSAQPTTPFVDESALRGLDFVGPQPTEPHPFRFDAVLGGGALATDMDDDGDTDFLLTSSWGDSGLYWNIGEGTFLGMEDSPLIDAGPAHAASAVDLDGDGLKEVFLLARSRIHMFRNLGGGEFAEETSLLIMDDVQHRATNLSWADIDGDGWLDVHVSMRSVVAFEIAGEVPSSPPQDRLFRGLGGLAFEEASHWLGDPTQLHGHAFVSTWLDVDDDSDLDLLVANDHGAKVIPNKLFLRVDDVEGEPNFEESSSEFGLDLGLNSMGVGVGDLEGDGTVEIAVSDTGGLSLVSMMGESAVDVALARGVDPVASNDLGSWGVEFPDLDNDGDRDFVAAWGWKEVERTEPNWPTLWTTEGDDSEDASHLLPPTALALGRTILPVDVDGDGTLELLSTQLAGPVSLARRPCLVHGWLRVRLEGAEGNRAGIGALVEVTVDGTAQWRRIELGSSGVHSALEPVAHFGLGQADSVSMLRVLWPDGTEQFFEDVEGNQEVLVVRE